MTSISEENRENILGRGCFVIAEIGKNFIRTEEEKSVKEYLQNAIDLVKAAKESGADAVKFQTHNFEDEQADMEVISPHFKSLDRYAWVKRNTEATPLEGFWKPLKKACDDLGIIFFTTPMSRGAAMKAAEVNPAIWKVGSGDILDFVLLDYLRQTGKAIILSTGMSTLAEVDLAVNFLKEKTSKIVLLHCVSRYPCPVEDLNIDTMLMLRERYGLPAGFSDHSLSADTAVLAAALGARAIEKHFSFDRGFWGSDHKVSLLPDEFREMVKDIRRLESDAVYREEVLRSELADKARGSKNKVLQPEEAAFRPLFRKTLVAAKDISPGAIISSEMLYAMRPGGYLKGLPSEKYPEVCGRKAAVMIKKYEPVTEEALE